MPVFALSGQAYLRWVRYTILVIAGVYLLTVVTPFFAHGVYQQPETAIMSGRFDPKDLAPYGNEGLGRWLYMLASLSVPTVLVAGSILGGLAFALAWTLWPRLSANERWWSGVTLALLGVALFFVFSPMGRLILTWWVD